MKKGIALWILIDILATIIACAILITLTIKKAKAEEVNLEVISQIESGNNPKAFNSRSGAVGLYQITAICLKDYNQELSLSVKKKELFNAETNFKIASWFLNKRIPQLLRRLGLEDTLENRLIAYNAGISYVKNRKPLPKETIAYIAKYKRLKRNA
jgi:soluble lytic murein transglycosylase-like protein